MLKLNVSIGSLSSIKADAARDAATLADITHVISVSLVKSDSGVSAQPVGEAEILRGATNRAFGARTVSDSGFGLGIENGIVMRQGRNQAVWHDVACVVLVWPDGTVTEIWTRGVAVSQWAVDEAEAKKITVGQAIANRYPEAKPSDPHSFLTSGAYSRQALLTEVIETLFLTSGFAAYAKDFAAAQQRGRHRISLGGETRDLPIRSAGPGKPCLAIFDPIDDTKLNAAAGRLLADRIRSCIEVPDYVKDAGVVLLMAEGKATPLLQVVATELDVPAVVVRKSFRPLYAGDDCLKVQYSSITSPGKVQEFHLTSDQAARLKGKYVILLDDVISSGGTSEGLRKLCEQVDALILTEAYVFCEGKPRNDVISLGTLPLYPPLPL